jgi:DNA-binding LacI/PurR family transcriptional regulator
MVTTGVAVQRKNVFAIPIDNETGSRIATEHLMRLGHDRIAHVTGPPGSTTTILRRAGYEKALSEAAIPIDFGLIEEADWSVNAGYAATERLLGREDFTAIVAQNDHTAVGCLRALRRRGLRVPDDVALVGFDNLPFADVIDPPLTTVNYPGRELGHLCVRSLVAMIEGDRRRPAEMFPEDHARLAPVLVVRESCGAHVLHDAPDSPRLRRE